MKMSDRTYWGAFYPEFALHKSKVDVRFKANMEKIARYYTRELSKIGQEMFQDKIDDTFIKFNFSWGMKRKTSNGGIRHGKGWVSLAMYRATMAFPFIEYDRINDDPVIGYMDTKFSNVHLATTLAHEISHAFAYLLKRNLYFHPERFTDAEKALINAEHGHNKLWQSIYRKFRQDFVNPLHAEMESNKIAAEIRK